ncbi:response regulator [Motilimonas eburnea]|uniref:response regulator n=1 Tax=Motilimonas eburnea TaxID=1737488 RepID=UPI001E5AC5E6|nr:response regulator transcription factor [Motilimonas eburnea]MCE2573039.1 response regulator transcription factor [Motilimonas eburnea]
MTSTKQILIVDDDKEIRELLQQYLSKSGFDVATAEEGVAMFQCLSQNQPDLIILDVMMPGDDGFTLCQKIRRDSNVPIIMLTANSDETDRVIGLEIGADDYIAKPFSPRELLARIKALLRRAQFSASAEARYIHFANWRLDTQKRNLLSEDGEELALSGADYNMLMLFLQHPNQILDRDTISDATRGREALPMERGIDVQLSRLRQRLGDNGKNPKLIKTIRGAGYVLIATVRHEG